MWVALIRNITAEFSKHFNMNSSFPKRGMTLWVPTIIWYFKDYTCSLYHLPLIKILICFLEQLEAWSKWRRNTIHSESTDVQHFRGLPLLSRTLSLPPSKRCLPANPALGINMRTSRKKDSILLDREQSVSFPKQISDRETRFPQLWWEFSPDMCCVRSYFTVGMQIAHLWKFFFLFPVNFVL